MIKIQRTNFCGKTLTVLIKLNLTSKASDTKPKLQSTAWQEYARLNEWIKKKLSPLTDSKAQKVLEMKGC